MWMLEPPARTVVATGADGGVLGTAKMHANYAGPGAHVRERELHGRLAPPAGAASGGRSSRTRSRGRARPGSARCSSTPWPRRTRRRSRSTSRCGFAVIATIPEAFRHPDEGDVALLVMHRAL